jgi:glycyl-tRNA synthetase beta chain
MFFRERLEFFLKDVRGYAYDVVKAVLAADANDVVDALQRAGALTKARQSRRPDFEAVCVSFKRIKNILKQAEENKMRILAHPDEHLMGQIGSAETTLWLNGAVGIWAQYEVWRKQGRYDLALVHTASLRPMLDKFFDEVMVMVDDEQVRANRLAILKKLYTSFSTIADFSEIVTEGKS